VARPDSTQGREKLTCVVIRAGWSLQKKKKQKLGKNGLKVLGV
jgi:hypothetical protein